MKKTELTVNNVIMAAMALKFLGDIGAFKQIDLHAAEEQDDKVELIEELTEMYRESGQQTVFDAFKTNESLTNFMKNHVFDGNQYTDKKKNTCESKKEEEKTKKHSTDQQAEQKSDKNFEEEFKVRTSEAILFLIEENEQIKEKLDVLTEQMKVALKLFIAKQEVK